MTQFTNPGTGPRTFHRRAAFDDALELLAFDDEADDFLERELFALRESLGDFRSL